MGKKRLFKLFCSCATLVLLLLGLMISSPRAFAAGVDPSKYPHSARHFSNFTIPEVNDDTTPSTSVQGVSTQSLKTQDTQPATFKHVDGDPAIKTVSYFKSSFTYQGTTYPYRMVGTDPARGSGITVTTAMLFPLKLVFADGSAFDSTKITPYVANSPVFRFGQFDTSFTQYGDVIQRDEFWNYVSKRSPGYHVWLGGPVTLPTITLNVPADQGEVVTLSTGRQVGLTTFEYMDSVVSNLYKQYHISPRVLPIFLVGDVFPGGAFGYHSAFLSNNNKQLFTYIVTNWLSKGTTGAEADEDASTLTHEVCEWINDPFVLDTNPTGISINITPEWFAQFYGCQNVLEVGDPVVIYALRFVGFRGFTYHLQDEVFLSWFAREVPSKAQGGRYTYMNIFSSPSTDCPPGS
jgi:hypothetical protein